MKEFLNFTLFTIGSDTPVLLIDLITSVLGLICVFLAGRNSKYNFWVGYLYTAALFFMFWNKSLYASLLLQPVSLGINILGHYRWTHPKKDEERYSSMSRMTVESVNGKAKSGSIIQKSTLLLVSSISYILFQKSEKHISNGSYNAFSVYPIE